MGRGVRTGRSGCGCSTSGPERYSWSGTTYSANHPQTSSARRLLLPSSFLIDLSSISPQLRGEAPLKVSEAMISPVLAATRVTRLL